MLKQSKDNKNKEYLFTYIDQYNSIFKIAFKDVFIISSNNTMFNKGDYYEIMDSSLGSITRWGKCKID